MLTVVCMKWGTAFPADTVNVLHASVRRNLAEPFRFVCFTDDAAGLSPGIEPQPIPEFGLPAERWRHGCWPKLGLFAPGVVAGELAMFLDLDLVLRAPLDPFFERARTLGGRLHIIREYSNFPATLLPHGLRPDRGAQSALFVWRPAEMHDVFSKFVADPEAAYRVAGNDQEYLTHAVPDRRYWPREWCVSFKRTCVWSWPMNRVVRSVPEPTGAKVVVFHGQPRPWDLVHDDGRRWGTSRRFGFGAVDWVKAYWERGLSEAGG